LVAAHLSLPIYLHENLKEAWFFVAPELPAFLTPSAILDGVLADSKQGGKDYGMYRAQVVQALRDILD
jgi:hypothetical protein